MKNVLVDYRCSCGHLLFKGLLLDSRVEVKCKKCGQLIFFQDQFSENQKNQYAIIFDQNHDITKASESAGLMLEYPQQSLIGKNLKEIAPLMDPDQLTRVCGRLRTLSPDAIRFWTVHATRSGKQIKLRARLRSHITNGQFFTIGIYERILDDEVDQLPSRNVLPIPFTSGDVLVVDDMITQINRGGFFLEVNQQFSIRVGRAWSTLIGTSFFDLIAPDVLASSKYIFDSMLAKGEHSFRLRGIALVDGNKKSERYDMHFVAFFSSENSIKGYSVIYQLAKES